MRTHHRLLATVGAAIVQRARSAPVQQRPTRRPGMPDLPTLQEQGLKGYECYTWNAILAPAGTPQSIVDKLSDAVAKSLADPVVFKRMQEAGVDPTPGMSPAKTAAFIKVELEKWGAIIKATGAQID